MSNYLYQLYLVKFRKAWGQYYWEESIHYPILLIDSDFEVGAIALLQQFRYFISLLDVLLFEIR